MTDERRSRPSASYAEQMRDCPASWLRQRGIEGTKSEDAESGDRIHAWLAGDESVKLLPEEVECAQECNRLAAELGESLVVDGTIDREQRFWADMDLLSAKLDHLERAGEKAMAIDYKTGFNEVTPAADNLQMRWQYLAAYAGEQDFYVAVIAPRNYGQKVTVARYGPEHYEPALAEAKRIIAAAEKPDAPAIPGESQCRYCKAKGVCPEYQSWARQVLPASIQGLPVGAWNAEQKVRFVVAAKAAEKLLEEKLAEIKAEVQRDPAGNPGLALRSTGSTRKIENPLDAYAAFASAGYATQFILSCKPSVPALEKCFQDEGRSKKDAAAKVAEILGPLIETTPKEPSLVVV